jgi:DNA repair protein RecN (Recombination protein N)
MLVKLSVQNYALIRELDIEFEKGLTIITGETGAGKSILLGALSLILGNRADTSVLLDKNEKCIVEGTFKVEQYDLNEFFAQNEIDYEPVSILRREINPAGKSRAFINDTPVTINLLKDLGEKLIDIHSQHQTLMLNNNVFQLNVVDSFAGTMGIKSEYRTEYSSYLSLKREYNQAKEKADKNRADLEYYQYQLKQLDDIKLKEGEQQELESEQEMLTHSEEIKLALCGSSDLFARDGESILSMLNEVKINLGKIKSIIPEGESLSSRAESSFIELSDLASELAKLGTSIEADPQRLTIVNDRLDSIYSLIQKHRVENLSELILKREEIRTMVNSIVSVDERMNELEKLLSSREKSLRQIASRISQMRMKVLPEIEIKITDLLKLLGMPNARFRVSLSQSTEFTSSGVDHVDFLFSANKQIEPENLARIASGGELSRVMLSLKSLLTKYNSLPTIIFDEIDSGVSGEVAHKMGQILSGMGNYMQVVNITHLPQVASRGSKHYHVYKDDSDNSTYTRVKLLNHEERVIEVARMLSGSEVTEAAIRNARELLESAAN